MFVAGIQRTLAQLHLCDHFRVVLPSNLKQLILLLFYARHVQDAAKASCKSEIRIADMQYISPRPSLKFIGCDDLVCLPVIGEQKYGLTPCSYVAKAGHVARPRLGERFQHDRVFQLWVKF